MRAQPLNYSRKPHMRTARFCLVLFAALSSNALCQSTPCASDNDTTNNVSRLITGYRSTGPGRWGFRYVPAKPVPAAAMRIFTGSNYRNGFMQLQVWTEGSGLPQTMLATGTWNSPNGTPNGWYGTNFNKLTILKQNVPYWIVWVEGGWNQVSYEGQGTSYKTIAWNGNSWASIAAANWKFRFYCGQLLDQKNAPVFGSACLSSSGDLGTTFSNMEPLYGTKSYRIEGTNFPPGAPAVFLLGLDKNFKSLSFGTAAPGCFLNTDIFFMFAGVTGTGDVRAAAAAGHTQIVLPLGPPVMKGTFLAMQIAVFDKKSTNPLYFAFGNAIRSSVF
ncbi:MAG: hypothetical protein CMJ85_13230 [Planctomycetes bacterium]|nr:hypothetical protein [Planctomycetota bacterium]